MWLRTRHGLDILLSSRQTPVARLHFFLCAFGINVLIACLKSLPQRIQTPDSSSTRWLLLWQKEDLNWRRKLRRTTKTIPFSRKSEGHCASIRLIFSCSIFTLSCYLPRLGFYMIRAAWSISTTIKKLENWRGIWRELRINQIMVKLHLLPIIASGLIFFSSCLFLS